MSILLDPVQTRSSSSPAERLRRTMAAEPFNAEASFLSAGKKLLGQSFPRESSISYEISPAVVKPVSR